MAASLITHELTKVYSGTAVPALDKLSLQVAAGEIYGFLGANGAGKSTTIRLLMNFLKPTSGDAQIMGLDVVRDSVSVKRQVGYLAGDVALYPKVTGRELLEYLSRLQGGDNGNYRQQLVERFEAELDKPINTLSKGNRQKIGILQALMHQPAVLILDEPTSGLDPLMQEVFYDALREAKQRGAAILMSSHNLDEAQRVCDRVGIIKHGRLLREQSVSELSNLTQPKFKVIFRTPGAIAKIGHEPALKLERQLDGTTALIQARGEIAPALAALSKYEIANLQTEQLSLEDEFISFYGEDRS